MDNKIDIRKLSNKELEDLWCEKRDELFEIRKEIDRRKNEKHEPVNVDFTSYITK